MKNARNNELADRRSAAADAKASLLNAYHAAKTAAEPSRIARQDGRMLAVESREARRVERDRLKLEERTRLEAMTAEEQAALEAERDRRYADCKARQA